MCIIAAVKYLLLTNRLTIYNFMKKLFISSVVLSLLFSCQKETEVTEVNTIETASTARFCASDEVLQEQLKKDPSLAAKMQKIEEQMLTAPSEAARLLADGRIEIPVIVNVIYKTAAENISNTQIQSQIDVLNKDFNGTNSDFGLVPALFSGVKATVGITFVLEQVIRRSSTKTSWSTNDDMKKAARGGIAPLSPTTKLNMWVVNKMTSGGKTILGYAQFPGGAAATDGVVIAYNYFGSTGAVSAPFNLGRTATHEVGHWMNLRHIWGDALCGSDLVADTPTHSGPNGGVPAYPKVSTCAGKQVEMTMNYMDYTDDRGMYMFSNGQKSRMNAIFAAGAIRSSFR